MRAYARACVFPCGRVSDHERACTLGDHQPAAGRLIYTAIRLPTFSSIKYKKTVLSRLQNVGPMHYRSTRLLRRICKDLILYSLQRNRTNRRTFVRYFALQLRSKQPPVQIGPSTASHKKSINHNWLPCWVGKRTQWAVYTKRRA